MTLSVSEPHCPDAPYFQVAVVASLFHILNAMHIQECNALTKILQIIGYMNDTIMISCLRYLLLGRTAKLCTINGMVGTE